MSETTLTQSFEPNSVELSTNAKGKVQASVKVYGDDPTAVADKAIATLRHIRTQLAGQMAE